MSVEVYLFKNKTQQTCQNFEWDAYQVFARGLISLLMWEMGEVRALSLTPADPFPVLCLSFPIIQ